MDLTIYTPACMARTSDTNTFAGKKALAYGEITLTFWYNKIIKSDPGWGKTTDNYDEDDRSEVLLEVELPVLSNTQCDDDWICAGGVAGEDTCQVEKIAYYFYESFGL